MEQTEHEHNTIPTKTEHENKTNDHKVTPLILASYNGEVEDIYYPPGHISFGRNPLKCDCSIKWILEDPKMLQIIDFGHPTSYNRPKCRDGTYVADLDLATLEVLCPDD